MQRTESITTSRTPRWVLALVPLLLLLLLTALFIALDPLAVFGSAFPPLEDLSFQRVRFPAPGQIEVEVVNGGPDPVTVAQVLVDDAYWQFAITPDDTLERLGSATITLAYPWVVDEPLERSG